MSVLKEEIKMLWSALDKTNQQLDRIAKRVGGAQHAPTPDYRMSESVQTCSCEEALALRAEAADLRVEVDVLAGHKDSLSAEVKRLTARLIEQVECCDTWRDGSARAENRCHELSKSLAAANARLVDVRAEVADWSRASWPDAQRTTQERLARLRANLAAQPATPACPDYSPHCARCRGRVVSATRTEAEHVTGCRYEQEFPAIDPEDCPRCSKVRTKAEKT